MHTTLLLLISCLQVILLTKCPYFKTLTMSFMNMKRKNTRLGSKVEYEENKKVSLLDVPELTLECILDKLPPTELRVMAAVSSYLRQKCSSDHLWEKHMKHKWGRVIKDAAYREWQRHIASKRRTNLLYESNEMGSYDFLFNIWPFSWTRRPRIECSREVRRSLRDDSIMAWYIAIESGDFWFPAQVYNRENGHVGFMLSCYDAKLSYDFRKDTFRARYPSEGRSIDEENIPWNRIRAPPIDTLPNALHISDCLNDLKPGDHIEIQWRKAAEFSYGWWYGVVSHLESCDKNKECCSCCLNDTVMLEFHQYSPDSRWRKATINRKNHREEGNGGNGFYGGIRKICKDDEISTWKRLCADRIADTRELPGAVLDS